MFAVYACKQEVMYGKYATSIKVVQSTSFTSTSYLRARAYADVCNQHGWNDVDQGEVKVWDIKQQEYVKSWCVWSYHNELVLDRHANAWFWAEVPFVLDSTDDRVAAERLVSDAEEHRSMDAWCGPTHDWLNGMSEADKQAIYIAARFYAQAEYDEAMQDRQVEGVTPPEQIENIW